MDLNKIKKTAQVVATAGGRMMTMNTADVFEMVELVERQEKELAGARFAAQQHLNTVQVQAAGLVAPASGAPDLPPLTEAVQKLLDRLDPADYPDEREAIAAALTQAAPASPASAPVASDPMPKRTAFIKYCEGRGLDVSVEKDAWGAHIFKHPHIQSMWEGWFNAPTVPVAQAGVPDGWKLVPVEPTPEMIENTAAFDLEGEDDTNNAYRIIYCAMLAAAPLPPVVARKVLTDLDVLADQTLQFHFGLNGGAGPVSKKGWKIINAVLAVERHLMGGE